ncbi:Homeodomain-like protein, partial [Basidiobolus meristosporus CBS 931.73]
MVNSRKPRRRTNKEEQAILEEAFQVNHRPSSEIKEQLARQLNMNLRTVQIWFQNRRQSLKK